MNLLMLSLWVGIGVGIATFVVYLCTSKWSSQPPRFRERWIDFEVWAADRGLDLRRSREDPGVYADYKTQQAWEAYCLGLNTPREIRI
jgi:hypothetical protein